MKNCFISFLFYSFLIFLFESTNTLNSITDKAISAADTIFDKTYVDIGRVGYYAEYLGTVSRQKPELKSENLIPKEKIPIFDHKATLTEEEKTLVLEESKAITSVYQPTATGSYDCFDQNGYLYFHRTKLKDSKSSHRKLYKHYGSLGVYG
ncbi:hypothetical protein M9Y10_035390 [Tritrichomonas musculus]|uniref:Uncharacterized protein n=1 Tax=Tritrichomonas musculus TaxID=1915356 RepID=A0ABR2KHI8_9EUKA